VHKIFLFILFISFIFSNTNNKDKYYYVVNPDGNPYEYLTAKGVHSGMTKDYLDLIRRHLSFELEVLKSKSWSDSKSKVKSGEADILLATSITKSRAKYLNFSNIYLTIHTAAITKKDFEGSSELSDLVKLRVTTINGYSTAKKLEKDYPNIKIIYASSIAECLLLISNGRADVAFLNLAVAAYGIRQNLFTNIKILKATKYSHKLAIGVKKSLSNSNKIVNELNNAIKQIGEEESSDIIKKWIKLNIQGNYIDTETIMYGGLLLLSLILPMIWYSFRLRSLNAKLNILATTDVLTGANNRRFIIDTADMEISRILRTRHKLSFLMFDIDKFKNFNDTYGHAVGDIALIEFVRTIEKTKRKSDVFGRIGGEEFCLLALDTDIDNACIFAEKLRQATEEIVMHIGRKKIKMTVSIGVSVYKYEQDSFDALMARADQALYMAKNNGRNRVERND
jgi:diguanylate cyclase (GGDEF)-like protein